ncbi:putative ORFan [Tupanvirus deep ocean]|uniref:ORFan n=2 Tax=Tupanvirus TaxID=2094720 RepID=A0AC62A7Q1_9VIRU|nr:putative ORFan [Tupanvirus deep ocean]QKU33759.1 putative ORFan [Tupanvirus deep ocean]
MFLNKMFLNKFFRLVLLVTLFGYCMANISMLTYQTPGTYLLKPEDYYYSDTIIFELWGGGAGGGNPEPKPCTSCGGGGGGSYLKAFVKTNNQTFNITIGAGGSGGRGDYKIFGSNNTDYQGTSGSHGESTMVISLDHNHVVNLVAGGGFSGDVGGIGGNVLSTKGSDNYIAIQGQSQQYFGHPTLTYLFVGGNGAVGGSGGNTYVNTKLHDIHYFIVGSSGGFPGGGGFGMSSTTFTDTNNSTTTCGSGANGSVVIYYENKSSSPPIILDDDSSHTNGMDIGFRIFSIFIILIISMSLIIFIVVLAYKCIQKYRNTRFVSV